MNMDYLISLVTENPMVLLFLYGIGIIVVSIAFYIAMKFLLFRLIKAIISKQSPIIIQSMESEKIFQRAALFAPLMIIYIGVKYFLVMEHAKNVHELLINLILIGLIIVIFQFVNSLLSFIINELTRLNTINTALTRTIHQVIKIGLVVAGLISTISILLNKSPVVILSSLGALTAIILLVFKDSILGFVASVQVTLLGIVKEGDWIEMPKYHADGNILDINISSIRVQNWDKTITTIPTYALVSEPVKNWKGMELSNARRIKRSILIDINSIKFCDDALLNNMKSVNILSEHLSELHQEIQVFNDAQTNNHQPLNTRALTNMGLFRQYFVNYLKNHSKINQSATILVRQLQSSETGVPLEIYCFTSTTDWIEYEDIQSDIFDHMFAIIGFFDLKVIQSPLKSSSH